MLVHQYLAALPNFTADETSTLYKSPVLATPKWRLSETLQAEAILQGNRETLRNIFRNGVKWQDGSILPSAVRAIFSASRLSQIFNLDCQVTINFEKRDTEAGTPVLVYHFTAPRDSCFGFESDGDYQRYYPGFEGEVFVAEADGLVRKVDCNASGFPAEFKLRTYEQQVTWDQIKIGEERHLLPVSAEPRWSWRT